MTGDRRSWWVPVIIPITVIVYRFILSYRSYSLMCHVIACPGQVHAKRYFKCQKYAIGTQIYSHINRNLSTCLFACILYSEHSDLCNCSDRPQSSRLIVYGVRAGNIATSTPIAALSNKTIARTRRKKN